MKHRLCIIAGSSCRASFFQTMKISSVLVCLFALVFTVGCSHQVVYRINPDTPPTMKLKEARDALELSLSLRNTHSQIESLSLKNDELLATALLTGRREMGRVEYDEISWEIIKLGDAYIVPIARPKRATFFYRLSLLSWKSEEDAKLFLNAFFSLRQFKIKGATDTDVVATAPTIKKVTSPKELARKEKPEQVESTFTDVGPLKTYPVQVARKEEPKKVEPTIVAIASPKVELEPAKPVKAEEPPKKVVTPVIEAAQAKPAPVITKPPKIEVDKTPPKITITEPDLTQAVSVVAKKTDTFVTGVVESKSGVMYILVNNQDADLDEKGNFSAVIPLKVGKNTVTVIAVDTNKNKSTKKFVVNREAGKVVVAKKAEDKMKAELSNSKYYALLIGVQDYDSPEIGKLDYPVSDAQRLGNILTTQYTFDKENVTTLVNPDRRTIYKTLQSLRNKLTETDNLLVFYAGHGFWVEDMKQGFWLPKDASGINDPSDWIPNSTVRDYIKAIKARHILLVADACFSGGIFKIREVAFKQKTYAEEVYELPSRKAITSGALKSVPDESVFLKYLVKRLKDNKEPYLDTQKLFASLREVVIDNSPMHQTPLYGAISEAGDEGGDFIFVRRQ